MKVITTGVEGSLQDVFAHPSTAAIVDAAQGSEPLRAMLLQIIRDFRDRESLVRRPTNLAKVCAQVSSRSRDRRRPVETIRRGIEALYAEFDPSLVRGGLLEALVQRSIQARYADPTHMLDNNLEVRIEGKDGQSVEPSTSIDVLGVDIPRAEGECHDCKVQARSFDAAWIAELITDVAPFGFRVGLVTADSRARALRELTRKEIRPASPASLIAADSWQLPLRPDLA